ncbi:MAG TPA: glycoside hydrolase family 28 protein [Opitutaceae bacterium]|nr:glycoside hydrolase family 28 protein [Opitutaceae bacterium]
MKPVLIFLIALLALPCLRTADAPATPGGTFNVRAFGATGDGLTKDTAALQKALDACAAAGGTVVVPAGVYLTGSIVLGPNTALRLEARASLLGSPDLADYPLVRVRWEGEYVQGHRALVSAEQADHITIGGPGFIFGPPLSVSRLRNPRGPALIELADSAQVVLEGFTTQYQQLWSIHLLLCRDLTIRNLVVRSTSYNGDGIDVDSCQDVLIEHCDINTGDDAISLKSGRGLAAVRLGRPTENVVIRDCSLVSSIFAGIGFGSEMSGGIRHVRLEHCTISGRQNGILFKSRDGRGGYFEDITGENLTVANSPTFLAIDLLHKGIQATDPVPGPAEQWARMHDIRFRDIRVDNVATLVLAANVPPERPIDGLSLTNITGTCGRGLTLAHATNVTLAGLAVTGFEGPLLTTTNVTGAGLDAR